ncbi:MAG: thiamine phosphate synthase [Armatimonadota bacterium]|nr:thiamine phosphate synthase [Armatimonadota bacterium]
MRIELKGLYVITDEELRPGRSHVDIASAAIEGGARIIQLRDKKASDREFYLIACRLREMTRRAGALFFVNDRVDVAAAVEADGVNVGQTDLPVDVVRKLLGGSAVIGVSVDSLEQALEAQKAGADYVGFGPVFPTTTKVDAGEAVGLSELVRVCEVVEIPVVAIGGISAENISSVAAAGAECAAVVSAVVCADDMVKAVQELRRKFEEGAAQTIGIGR